MDRFEFFDRIPAMPQEERQLIHWAYSLAQKYHAGQFRDDGKEYFVHVEGTANILIDHGYTHFEDIILGMLHDSFEDTDMPVLMCERLFGPQLTREILSVSKTHGMETLLDGSIIRTPKMPKARYFATVRRCGMRAARAKLADRIQNNGDLTSNNQPEGSRWTPQKRLQQAEETREWIIPLAQFAEPRFEVLLLRQCEEIERNVQLLFSAPKNT